MVPEAPDRPDLAGDDHPMRVVTRQVAFEPGGWTPTRAAKVAALFDGLAPEWHARTAAEHRHEPLCDALDRGGVATGGRCLEVGSGTGSATPHLAAHFAEVVCIDLSAEMLRLAEVGVGWRVRADAAALPVADGAAEAVVLVNALLFPGEVARALAPGGAVVWVSTIGDRTPIYLPADDVARALPGEWDVVASEAGWGSWAVLRRA